jgi:hypothetical protein
MPDQATEHAVLIPAQPAMLVLGDRRIPVHEWPLAPSVAERNTLELVRTEDDQLVIAPKPRTGASIVVQALFAFVCITLPTLVATLFELPGWLGVALTVLIAAVFVLFIRGQLSRLRWARFDRRSGRLVIERKIGFKRKVRVELDEPLTSILAVQLLYNGRHSVTEPQGAGDQQTITHREFYGYELNLLVDGRHAPRWSLVSMADWAWIREAGRSIGEFLGVPVIDALRHGG